MAYRVLSAADAFWRPSNQMKVENTDLGKQLEATQLGATQLGARLWRLAPGQASTKHRHFDQEELYVLLEGHGRARVDDELLDLEPLDAMLVVGAPQELANTLEMSEEQLARLYPDGPQALPPELQG
ncbi:MAG TPA: cupin domain-containing protein [Solirubrobacterales bacterium]|nr:cupin domain-containing protein [Solirubrobacterales bacterium]